MKEVAVGLVGEEVEDKTVDGVGSVIWDLYQQETRLQQREASTMHRICRRRCKRPEPQVLKTAWQ